MREEKPISKPLRSDSDDSKDKQEETPSESFSPDDNSPYARLRETSFSVSRGLTTKDKKVDIGDFLRAKVEKKIKQEENVRKKRKLLIIGGVAFLIIVAIATVFAVLRFARRNAGFQEDSITLEVEIPSSVRVGEEITFRIIYENHEDVDLTNMELSLSSPENFVLLESDPSFSDTEKEVIALPDLKAKEKAQVRIKGQLFGHVGTERNFFASLAYIPSNFNSTFKTEKSFSVKLEPIPIKLGLEVPETIEPESNISCTIEWRNESKEDFSGLYLKVFYPSNFTFVKADRNPEGEGHDLWNIGDIPKGASGRITITGIFKGEAGDEVEFSAGLGKIFSDGNFYKEVEAKDVVKIVIQAISLTLTSNKKEEINANLGGEVNLDLSYKNKGSVGLKGVVITADLNNIPYLDLDSVKHGKGYWNDNKITWNNLSNPNLALLKPNKEGNLGFSIKLQNEISISNPDDKNFSFDIKVYAESEDLPQRQGSNPVRIKINSSLEISGYATKISSGGGFDTYTIHWVISSGTNDLKKAKVKATVPNNVDFAGGASATLGDGKPAYVSSVRQVIWNIGTIPANSGKEERACIGKFNVKVVSGFTETLILNTEVVGEDNFTSADFKKKINQITTGS